MLNCCSRNSEADEASILTKLTSQLLALQHEDSVQFSFVTVKQKKENREIVRMCKDVEVERVRRPKEKGIFPGTP